MEVFPVPPRQVATVIVSLTEGSDMSGEHPIASTILFGGTSIALYALLLTNSDLLVELAQRTKNGEKWLFLVPIIVAFVFSYIHGTFTAQFWERVGLRAASHITGTNKH